MPLSTDAELRNAIRREADLLSGASGRETQLSDREVNDLIDALRDVPEDMRETQMRELVNDVVQKRIGDPTA